MKSTSKMIAGAALVSLLVSPALAHDLKAPKGKEKCYGIAKAGKNTCASADGSHGCAGLSKTDNNPHEFMLVKEGACKEQGGMTAQEMKEKAHPAKETTDKH